jgi:hypothetical protein
LAAELGPTQEIYSIDESFIGLHGVGGDLGARARAVRERIWRCSGLPCGIGIGATKTLAKLANHIAKTAERKPGSYPSDLATVCNFATLPASDMDAVMAATEVGEVWGVGRQIGRQLRELGVHTVLDLARMPTAQVRQRWGVVLERTPHEYSYKDSSGYHFLDPITYEDAVVYEDLIEGVKNYLIEGQIYNLMVADGIVVAVDLPLSMVMTVTESSEGVKGDSANNVYKPAVMQTGLIVQVPLFINVGEKINVKTEDNSYTGRAQG